MTNVGILGATGYAGAELARLPGLEADRDALATSLAFAEADRAARLAVIQQQGAELAALRATLENVRRLAEGGPPKARLGMAPPSEVRRVSEMLSEIAALMRPNDRT